MADVSVNQDPDVGAPSDPSQPGNATPRLRSARPLKVAKALPPTVPTKPVAGPAADATLKRPVPLEGNLARPIPLSEARAAGLVKPVAAPSSAEFPEAVVSDAKAATDTEEDSQQSGSFGLVQWKWAASSWGISLIVHLVILLVLGLIVGGAAIMRPEIFVSLSSPDPLVQPELQEVRVEKPELDKQEVKIEDQVVPVTDTLDVKSPVVDHLDPGAPANTPDNLALNEIATGTPLNSYGTMSGLDGKTGRRGKGQGSGHATSGIGSHLGGRAERRAALAMGGPSVTDPVVDEGLNWLARHQLPDGGWAFNHTVAPGCNGQCPTPGELQNARIAATGMALLPFLGAGHSHADEKSPYWRTVSGGLRYLMANQGPNGGLWEEGGQMYGHGIATLALCEAFGVANQQPVVPDGAEPDYNVKKPDGGEPDPKEKAALEKAQDRQKKFDKAVRVNHRALGMAARNAVKMTMGAQHPEGGWRYHPGESGDMSVVGWQVMALASAQQAGFGFNRGTRDRAFNFLKICGGNMQGDQHYGAVPTRFSYVPLHRADKPAVTEATTAIGLLSMIYMGVHPHHPGMEVAVQRLRQQGPNIGDMYATYYQNQIMYQHGGPAWDEWKQRMEAAVTGAQAKGGHVNGSWHLGGDHGSSKGGRVYCTVMALLCLEENYRHMRLFENAQANQQAKQVPPALGGAAQPGAAQGGGAGGAVGADGQPALPDPLQGGEAGEAAGIIAPGAGVDGAPPGGNEQAAGPANAKAEKKPGVAVGEDGFPLE